MAERVSRQQRQQQTRDRLIATAERMFARGGVQALSIRTLCEEAGFSQGAFYSNFESRDALLLAVLDRHIRREVEELRALLEATRDAPVEAALIAIARKLGEMARDSRWSLLSVELQLQCRRDPAFDAASRDVTAQNLAAFAELIERLTVQHGLRPALPAADLARGLYALWSGMALQGEAAAPAEGASRDAVFLAFLRSLTGIAPPPDPNGNLR